jgi:hypothetical protein
MKPGLGRCSFMLCLRATDAGSLLRFWFWRPSKRTPWEARRGEAAEPAELAELADEVESERSVRGTKLESVVSTIVDVGGDC